MPTIHDFIAQFTDQTLDVDRVRNEIFLKSPAPKIEGAELRYKSMRLGWQRGNSFKPAPPLLNWLADKTDRKATLTDEAAWLFICGNNVLKESMDTQIEEGLLLVQNSRGEILGYGKRTGAGISNNFHIGDYLHREK